MRTAEYMGLTAAEAVAKYERTTLLCTYCGRQFSCGGNRNRHAKVCDMQPNAAGVDLRPFKCQFCGKGFKDESNARAHSRRGACLRGVSWQNK